MIQKAPNEIPVTSGLVSIIMPNYNGSRYIKETIFSVLNQTYKNWEIVFVDDCSTDNSVEMLKSFKEPRIRIFVNEMNKGAAYSRNFAVEQARGQYIAYLDSDDLWLSTKLEHQVSFMQKNSYHFSCTKYQEIDDNNTSLGFVSAPTKITYLKMLCYDWVGCLTVMYDASAIGKVIFTVDGRARDDYVVFLEVSKKATCYYLNELLAQYRVHEYSLSRKNKINLFFQNYRMYRLCEEKNVLTSLFFSVINVFCWIYKRSHYRETV